MFVACGIWCLADVSSVSPSSEQAKFVLFGKIEFYCGKMLVFIWPNWLHFGKIGSIRENCF